MLFDPTCVGWAVGKPSGRGMLQGWFLLNDERDAKVKRLAAKIDRVLVDAPCSGFGTLRRNPDLKWRQTSAAIDELAAKQARIRNPAASLVKPGGSRVYAT